MPEYLLRIHELKLHPDHTDQELKQAVQKALKLGNQPFQYEIRRKSIDARKKPEILYSYTVDVKTGNIPAVLKKSRLKHAELIEEKVYHFPYDSFFSPSNESGRTVSGRPVVIGSGPAGLFCALMLARAGLKPLLVERGECVEERVKTVDHFWKSGELDPESNVQFGEGGAGTFSDGKLNTQIKDPEGRIRFILEEFVRAGADRDILTDQKPHVGTDRLRIIVSTMRKEIESLGGTVHFRTCVNQIEQTEDGRVLLTLRTDNGQTQIVTDAAVLAVGHSSRDTFRMLEERGISMQAKAFAAGFRIEHPQKWINNAMYGEDCVYDLGAAPYKVTWKTSGGRGVYSFCMCPGGYVVNASSEPGHLCVNGMSYSGRDSSNANSAIIVTVTPEDYAGSGPLAGVEFQRRLERNAYLLGNGKIPVQRYEDFAAGKKSTGSGTVHPCQKGESVWANLRDLFPEEINQAICEGIEAFGRMIPGFSDGDAVLSAVESRTSSPLRILRDETMQSSMRGLYPCGEGAGYAGGIVSAAADGIRTAEAICARYKKEAGFRDTFT